MNVETILRWSGSSEGVAGCAGKPDIAVNPPPEFGGAPGRWTPEDLLLSAIESCVMMTALNIAQRQKLALKGYTSKATAQLAKTPEGLRFTGAAVAIDMRVADPADIEKAVRLVAMAEKYCPISNALKFPVHVTAQARV